MPHFEYKARGSDGRIATGGIEAPDRRNAARQLNARGLTPVTLRQNGSGRAPLLTRLRERAKVLQPRRSPTDGQTSAPPSARAGSPRRERVGMVFLKRLLELNGSGLPIGDSVRILGQRLSDPEQKQLANAIWRDLSEGGTLAGALTRQPKYFAASVAYVIEAGEATGNLAPILRKVVDYLEEKHAIRKTMLASMAYPAFVCSVAIAVVVLFLLVLLPEIEGMLSRLGGDMTWSARLLIDGADFLVRFGPVALLLAAGAVIGFLQWRKTDHGRRVSDKWLLRAPLIGPILYYGDLFQSGNLVTTLLESGINTTETLNLTEKTLKNTELRERFHVARTQVNEGLSLAQAFKRNGFMPDLSVDILTVGENTGNLTHSMGEVTRGFRETLTARLQRLTTLVSTGALVFAFALVALIAIGIVTSVFQVSRTLSV